MARKSKTSSRVRAIRSLGSALGVPLKENEEGVVKNAVAEGLAKAGLVEVLGPADEEAAPPPDEEEDVDDNPQSTDPATGPEDQSSKTDDPSPAAPAAPKKKTRGK